mgnify:CR=1 FL=1
MEVKEFCDRYYVDRNGTASLTGGTVSDLP